MHKVIIGLAALAFGASGTAHAQDSWRVSEASGDVRVTVNGQTRPVTRGMLLASGSTIASGARARAVLVHQRDYVILSPSSRVRLPGTAQVTPASGGNWMTPVTQIMSEAGTALYRIEHRANPHFRVQTPYLAAVVKGTVFSVTVSAAGASVQVTQGAVEVSTVDGGAAELVRPGMVATVESGDLMELNIRGEVSRSIRSSGTPLPGVATVPVADAGRYDGPSDAVIEVVAPVREDPVSLADATNGLVSGQPGVDPGHHRDRAVGFEREQPLAQGVGGGALVRAEEADGTRAGRLGPVRAVRRGDHLHVDAQLHVLRASSIRPVPKPGGRPEPACAPAGRTRLGLPAPFWPKRPVPTRLSQCRGGQRWRELRWRSRAATVGSRGFGPKEAAWTDGSY